MRMKIFLLQIEILRNISHQIWKLQIVIFQMISIFQDIIVLKI